MTQNISNMVSEQTFDFIVVGAGPAGCTLAAFLAKSAKRPSVLLLEAGGQNDDKSLRVDGKRWTTFMQEQMNWGYKTTPQEHCNGRRLDYSRGKGLGGGSAINFGVYTVGSKDDYDEWASVVGDETFSWKNMQTRFKNLETFAGSIDLPENQKYGGHQAGDHGDTGGLQVGYAKEWENDLSLVLDAFEQAGVKRNMDHNSGNPLGISLCINSAHKGLRTTAVDLLSDGPDNLFIVTDSPVQRVILEGKTAIGVQTNRNRYLAAKEVILSAGSLDTPKILMHSGIGPANDLARFNIPVIQDLPAIGRGLRDHFFVPIILARNPASNDRNTFFQDQTAMTAAMKQWEKDGTGPWARYACQLGVGWLKSEPVTSSAEFNSLAPSIQDFLNRETIPHYEILTHFPAHFFFPQLFQDYSYISALVFLMNEQSAGEVRLQSSNPNDPLLFDPKFLSHPFDRRACIEIFRHLWDLMKHKAFAKDTISTIMAPASESDEDILQFWKDNLSSSWHMTGTVKMGKNGADDAAVDNHFRVFGIENLRVVDMSVVPVLPNAHTQAPAYVTGATGADVLIREYRIISSEEIIPTTKRILEEYRAVRNAVSQSVTPSTACFEDVVQPRINVENRTQGELGVIAMLRYASPDQAAREASDEAVRLMGESDAEFTAREDLYVLVKAVADKAEHGDVEAAKYLGTLFTDFRRCGHGVLNGVQIKSYLNTRNEIDNLRCKFNRSIRDEDGGLWFSLEELDGVSEQDLSLFPEGNEKGTRVVPFRKAELDIIMKYARNPLTRKKMYVGDAHKLT
ncbi:hypothetical protein CNMCM5793_007949 [Aspergillus hiratsukae]|nr:hypothetical protein CNMCM5793_007949 [Aspergillus hiratsukae]